jgi:hypothetical protein
MSPKNMCVIAIVVYLSIITLVVVNAKKSIPEYRVTPKCPVQVKLERYIDDHYIAEVISKTKRPYIMAAIKIVETEQAGPLIKGDNGDSHGMFQIQPKHHGVVPDSVEGQTEKAARILELLIQRRGITAGIQAYNGSGHKARLYAKKVMSLATKIEKG